MVTYGKCYYKVPQVLLQCDKCYCKVWQVLLQSVTSVIAKYDKCYCKVWQVLLQSVKRVITRYDKCYYKVRRVVEKYDKCFYQVWQVLLQTAPSVITKREKCFLTKNAAGVIMRYDKWYSTGWQVLSQSVTTVLQIAISVITKCGNFRRKRNDCLEQTLKIVYLAIVAEFLENYTGGDRSGDRGSSDGGGRGKGCTTQKRFQFQVDYMTGKDFKCSATERTIPTKTDSKMKTPDSSQLIYEFKP